LAWRLTIYEFLIIPFELNSTMKVHEHVWVRDLLNAKRLRFTGILRRMGEGSL